ncbi:unnamed protein product [Ophioblennius macclurei]
MEQQPLIDVNTIFQQLPHLLNVPPHPGQEQATIEEQCNIHMQIFWVQIIEQPPENLDQNLEDHLRNVENKVVYQLERLETLLQPLGLMGNLVGHCHQYMTHYLQNLLQMVSSSGSCFKLMYWARNTYLSIELLSQHNSHMIDGWDEWETKARCKFLQTLQKEIRGHLDNILQSHKCLEPSKNKEEDYVQLHVDVIQCTFAKFGDAKVIDQELSNQVLEVCSEELLTFVKGYNAWQKMFLEKQEETIHFLKTLKTCNEIRTYIQNHNMKETVALLNELETFTEQRLLEVVAEEMEKSFKRYFKKDNGLTYPFTDLEKLFPHCKFAEDEHKAVMGDIYKIVAHIYFKLLIGTSMRKLRRKWSTTIGTTVHEDAVHLHTVITDRAKDVQPWNKLLLRIEEVLDCSNVEGMKLTIAVIQKECHQHTEDLLLLPHLLLWRGYSGDNVRAVMDALPISPPMPNTPFWWFQCCC